MLSSTQFHSDFKALIVSTLEVGVQGLQLERELKANALTSLLAESDATFSWQALEPAMVRFELEQEGAHAFLVHLKARLTLECACVRCLSPVAHAIVLNFSIRMLEDEDKKKEEDALNELTLDSDSVLEEGEYSVGYFSGRSIDLGLILREQIFLEVPDYPKCGGEMAISKESCELPLLEHEMKEVRENPFVRLFKKN